MSIRAREYTREQLKIIIDRAMGTSRTVHGALASRQAQTSIGNKHMLPVRVLSVLTSTPNGAGQPLQAASGALAYLPGYSAAPGSPEADADGTGRGGDTAIVMRASGSGGGRGSAALKVLFPLTAEASGGSTGTATLTVV